MARNNNSSNDESKVEATKVILLKIVPVILIIIFAFLFKHLNNYSYCNLKGQLCDDPDINIADNSIVNISCKVSDNKGNIKKSTSIHLIRFTYVIFGLILLAIIVIAFGVVYDAKSDDDILDTLIILLLAIIIVGSIIYVLVDNSDEIKSGHIGYGLSKGFINLIWIINILYLIFLIIYIIVYDIKKILINDFSIIIITISIFLQVIIYIFFRYKCGSQPEYKCIPDIINITPKQSNPKAEQPITIINGKSFTQITSDKLRSEYKIECISSGINRMNIQTVQTILAIIAIIALLINIEHIFNSGIYILTVFKISPKADKKAEASLYSNIVSIIIVIALIWLITLSFI